MNRVCADFNVSPEAAGAHSGFTETSCVRAVREDLVDMKSAEPGYVGVFDSKVSKKLFKKGMTALAKNEVLRDPRGSSAEAGQRIFEELSNEIVSTLTKMGLKT